MLIRLAFHPKACSKLLRALMKKIRSFTESMVVTASGSIPESHWRRSPSTRSRHRSKVSIRKDKIDQIPIRSSSSRIHGDLPECRRLKRRSRVHIKKASINGPRFCRDRDNLAFPGNVNECRRHGDFSSFMIRIGQEAACNSHEDDRAQNYPLTCGNASKNSSVTGSDESKVFSQTFKDLRNRDSSLPRRTVTQESTVVCSDERISDLDPGNMYEANMDTYAMSVTDQEAYSIICKVKHQKNIIDPVNVNALRRRRSRSDGCSVVIDLDQDFRVSGLNEAKKSSLWGERTNLLSDSCSLHKGRRYGGFPSYRRKSRNGPEVCHFSDQAEESSINASDSGTIPVIETISSSEKHSISSDELNNSLESVENRGRFAISGFYSSSANTHIDSNVGPSWIHEAPNELPQIHQKRDVGKSMSSTYGDSSSISPDLQCDLSPIYRDSCSTSVDVPSGSTSSLNPSSNNTIEMLSSKCRSNSSSISSNYSSGRRSCASNISSKLHGSDRSPEHRDSANIPANLEVLGPGLEHRGLSAIYPNLQYSTLMSSERRDSSSITVGESLDLSSLSITSTDLLTSDLVYKESRGLTSSTMSAVLPKSDHLTSNQVRGSSGSYISANLPRFQSSSRHTKDPAESIMSSEDLTSRSLAMVKMSENPAEDFRHSMHEMMMTTTMGSEDMEELLRCYLTLNSPQLHGLIQEVFCDVWRTISAES